MREDETFWYGMMGAVLCGVLLLQVAGPLGGLLGAAAGAIMGAALKRIIRHRA
jgi:hypothetical protein